MTSTLAAGRRLARRGLTFQLVATMLAAAACMAISVPHGAGALLGGAGMALGGFVASTLGLRGVAPSADAALVGLLLGQLAKWGLVVATLAFGIAVLKLPALAVLGGLVASMLAFHLAMLARSCG